MRNFQVLDLNKIESSIIKGAKYLLQSVFTDNGIKFEDEGSIRSGIWVTAEALEFFLTTRTLPIVSYSQVQPMLEYILSQQRDDGSWTILSQVKNKKDESSTISTGHCVYVLKLAISEDFLTIELKSRVLDAIKEGESWLRSCSIDKISYTFWGTKKIKSCDPNIDERSRIEYVFDTFYAVMGLTNPKNYPENSRKDESLIHKTCNFFKMQAEWFTEHYTDILSKNANEDLSNVVSTFCRIVNMTEILGCEIFNNETKEKIKQIIAKCDNPFSTTKVTIDNNAIQAQGLTYTNNTPFDMGMALMNLQTNIDTLQKIIQTYLDKQDSINGYWYLNFKSAYKIKTWTTSEALLVLDKAFRLYKILELEGQRKINDMNYEGKLLEVEELWTQLKTKEINLGKENRKLRVIMLISITFSILFAVLMCVVAVYYISLPENKDKPTSGIIGYIIVPALFMIISQIIAFIVDLNNRKK